MSLPAAVLPAPIAVLVLAWEEATPAVWALVEATQAPARAVDSILVMVPQADAPAPLSAAEYRPLPEPTALAGAAAAAAAPATAAPAASEQPVAAPAPANTVIPSATQAEEELAAVREPAAAPAPPVWAAVRVLRLGSLSLRQLAQRAGQPLPAPAWTGAPTKPAAPYLGATDCADLTQPTPSAGTLPAEPAAFEPQPLPFAAMLPTSRPLPGALTAAVPAYRASSPAAGPPQYETAEPAAQAPDLEADRLPGVADEPANFGTGPTDLRGGYAGFAAGAAPAQAGWPEALAALRQPAAPSAPGLPPVTPAPEAGNDASGATRSALRPAAPHYPAPDLNFQIIQYARFAVPVALAEPDFAAIYAPAWPTWLAAQELRQRTGRPLVLHVAALAAPETESADTATGWIAELQRQALRRADLVLTETPALAQRLRHELGLAAGSVRAVPAADTGAIARALHGARPRPAASLT